MVNFTEDYITALKNKDAAAMVALIDTLKTDDEKKEALAAVVAAVEADKSVLENAEEVLDGLHDAQDKNAAAEAVIAAVKPDATVDTAPITDCAVTKED